MNWLLKRIAANQEKQLAIANEELQVLKEIRDLLKELSEDPDPVTSIEVEHQKPL